MTTLRTEDFEALGTETLLGLIGTTVKLEGLNSDDEVVVSVIGVVHSMKISPEKIVVNIGEDNGLSWETEEFYARVTWSDNRHGVLVDSETGK